MSPEQESDIQVPTKGNRHSNLTRGGIWSFRPGQRFDDDFMQLLHGSHTRISPGRKDQPSVPPSSVLMRPRVQPAVLWPGSGDAPAADSLAQAVGWDKECCLEAPDEKQCSLLFLAGSAFLHGSRSMRKSWPFIQVCSTFRRNFKACLRLRKPVDKNMNRGGMRAPLLQAHSLHEPQGRGS